MDTVMQSEDELRRSAPGEPLKQECAMRKALAGKLRYAADCLEREGVNSVRLWTAEGVCLAALNDIHRAMDYGRPGAGIDELLGAQS